MVIIKLIQVTFTILYLFRLCISSLGRHHFCNYVGNESAGSSGTVNIEGECELTLTNITGRISILGVDNSSCDSRQQLTLNDGAYCVNVNAMDTVIDVNDTQLVIAAKAGVKPSTIEYYHGKPINLKKTGCSDCHSNTSLFNFAN